MSAITKSASKKIVIIAGPNGAGKTTFAREFLPNEAHCPIFINADLIAAGLSPFAPDMAAIKAGKLMLKIIGELTAGGESFAFETTLSGRGYAKMIPEWRKLGYHIRLIFLQLPGSEAAIARVATRVLQGGHNIPEETIRRRFDAGLENFHQRYKQLVDVWLHYDNAGDTPTLIDWGSNES
jgi:predicted ABC-type ATPase